MRAMLCRAFELGIAHFNLANNCGPPPVLGRGELRPGLCARIWAAWRIFVRSLFELAAASGRT
jgi:aryl-alcohol dehydrogenase-like predicted oxidoreductase